MQVICTSIKDFTNGQALRLGLCEVGNTYTVIDECIGFGKDMTPVDCYIFEEFDDDFDGHILKSSSNGIKAIRQVLMTCFFLLL